MAKCERKLFVVLILACRAFLVITGNPNQENKGLLKHPYTTIHQDSAEHNLGSETATEISIRNCPRTCYCNLAGGNYLYVTNCATDPLDQLPDLFKECSQIKTLHIGNSHLSNLPSDTMKVLPSLINLGLEINVLYQIPKEIFKMTKLWKLTLKDDKIQLVPPEISKLTHLEELEMSWNALESLPAEITELSMLRYLGMDRNKITALPPGLSKLTTLETISFNHNQIKGLPEGMSKLNRLKNLQLSFNCLTALPDDLWNLNLLEHLELQHNEIQTISCQAFKVFSLTYIDLSHNALRRLDCDIQDNMLGKVNLSHNHLENMPCSLRSVSPSYLDISYNEILTLPCDCPLLSRSIQLTSIDISFNRITVLHNLTQCTLRISPEHLLLNDNKISVIDEGTFSKGGCLTPSGSLDLSNNKLTSVGVWPLVLSFSKTKTIDLSGNMLSRFTNSDVTHVPLRSYHGVIIMKRNQIKHFMDVINGWNVSVNSKLELNRLMTSTTLDLSENPLICDCVDYEIYQSMQAYGKWWYSGLVCDKPLALKGQNPGNISLESFVCDITVECPPGCTCTDIPHFTFLVVTCMNYSQTVMPTVIPELPNRSYMYHLDFSDQNLSVLTSRPYLRKATEIIMTNNNLQSIGVESLNIFEAVQKLYLDGNQLQRLPGSIMKSVTKQTAVDVKLGNNPWLCDCTTMAMKNWIVSNSEIFTDQDLIICQSPPSMAGTKVRDIRRSLVCLNENKTITYIVVVVAVLLLVGMTYFTGRGRYNHVNRQRLVGRDEHDDEDREFDVFVSYATEDEAYVEGFLIPELEKHDYKVCFHRVHFHGGKPILLNISEAIDKSKRTLVFFSNHFNKSPFGMFEFRLAYHLDVDNNTRRLITIKDTDLDMDSLSVSESHYFLTYTYIRKEEVHFWRNLETTLPRKRLGAEVP